MNDVRTVRLVVILVGSFSLAALIGSLALIAGIVVFSDREISPEAVALVVPISNLASAGLGALAAMLVSTGSVDLEGLKRLGSGSSPEDPANPTG